MRGGILAALASQCQLNPSQAGSGPSLTGGALTAHRLFWKALFVGPCRPGPGRPAGLHLTSLNVTSSRRHVVFAGHGLLHTPKLVVFQLGTSASEDHFQLAYPFPSEIAGFGSMLNDFNLSPDAARPRGRVHNARLTAAYVGSETGLGFKLALHVNSSVDMQPRNRCCTLPTHPS